MEMGESTLHRAQAFSIKLLVLRTCARCSHFFCLEAARNAEAGRSSMSISGFLPPKSPLSSSFFLYVSSFSLKQLFSQMLCSGMQCPPPQGLRLLYVGAIDSQSL